MYTTIITKSPLGSIFLEASNQGVTKVILGWTGTIIETQITSLPMKVAVDQINAYFSGKLKNFSIPIDLRQLSTFQQQILTFTQLIPYGEVRSYGFLARQINKPGASQAIGMVMKKNPLPIIVPCHRVVASDGRLHGYSAVGGLLTKAWLLELEGLKIVDQRLV